MWPLQRPEKTASSKQHCVFRRILAPFQVRKTRWKIARKKAQTGGTRLVRNWPIFGTMAASQAHRTATEQEDSVKRRPLEALGSREGTLPLSRRAAAFVSCAEDIRRLADRRE